MANLEKPWPRPRATRNRIESGIYRIQSYFSRMKHIENTPPPLRGWFPRFCTTIGWKFAGSAEAREPLGQAQWRTVTETSPGTMPTPSFFAIIPAAGHSRRMGQPKLLLPWRGTTVIAHLVGELRAAGIPRVFVVLRSDDEALYSAVVAANAVPLQPPTDPPDMRSSVEYGLNIAAKDLANPTDGGWLLVPADHPIVSRTTVTALQRAWQPEVRQILIPTFDGQRGHPTLFSCDFSREVAAIPADCGLNWLVRQNANSIREVPVTDSGVLVDLDTPEDYQALLKRPE